MAYFPTGGLVWLVRMLSAFLGFSVFCSRNDLFDFVLVALPALCLEKLSLSWLRLANMIVRSNRWGVIDETWVRMEDNGRVSSQPKASTRHQFNRKTRKKSRGPRVI